MEETVFIERTDGGENRYGRRERVRQQSVGPDDLYSRPVVLAAVLRATCGDFGLSLTVLSGTT